MTNGRTVTSQGAMDAFSYRELMRHQAGAVTIVAAGRCPRRAGLTATAVASLSDSPPTILACVGNKTGTHSAISQNNVFSINVLASDQQKIAERFAGKQNASGEARFEDLNWSTADTGAPILTGALAVLECALLEKHDFSTHSIFVGRVLRGRFQPELSPLLYFRGDYWDLAGKQD